MAVLVIGGDTNHVLHFLIGLLTCGLWWFVWLFFVAFTGKKRFVVTVDESGAISVEEIIMTHRKSGVRTGHPEPMAPSGRICQNQNIPKIMEHSEIPPLVHFDITALVVF